MWSRDLVDAELDALVSAFKAKGIARVSYKRAMSCVSLICNVEKTSQILERVRVGSACFQCARLLQLSTTPAQDCTRIHLRPRILLSSKRIDFHGSEVDIDHNVSVPAVVGRYHISSPSSMSSSSWPFVLVTMPGCLFVAVHGNMVALKTQTLSCRPSCFRESLRGN